MFVMVYVISPLCDDNTVSHICIPFRFLLCAQICGTISLDTDLIPFLPDLSLPSLNVCLLYSVYFSPPLPSQPPPSPSSFISSRERRICVSLCWIIHRLLQLTPLLPRSTTPLPSSFHLNPAG